MSQFNTKLDEARSRKRRLYWVSCTLAAAIFLLVFALFVVSRGTRVEILPADAGALAEIEVSSGAGFSVGTTVYSFFGYPVVRASAHGFKETEKTIDGNALGKAVTLELFELPGQLTVELSGDNEILARTAWRINGREIAFSANLDVELEPGSYTVEIDNGYHLSKSVEVELRRDEQTRLEVELEPVQGLLNLSSQPSGAAVYLDEKHIGKTPLQMPVTGDNYELKLVADNYIEVFEKVAVSRTNREVTRNYALELRKGKVAVDLVPDGGTLLINGVTAKEPFILDATVQHRLTYIKPGYYQATKTVILAPGEERRISFTLQEERGRVEISSTPRANIFIGKKDYGLSPVQINLQAVSHTIIFRKQGYRSVTKIVKPKGGTTQKVSASLLTEHQARLREAPEEYTNSAGIKLKFYRVRDRFIMGAPRSEKGQRANEFQREVMLTKPFYAGLHEITNGQFARFNPQRKKGNADLPVTMVSWQEAAAYCNWLSEKEGFQPVYYFRSGSVHEFDALADGYRLLSEAEWEWLARKAGKREQTVFSWGNDTVIPPNAANIADQRAQGQVRFFVPNYKDGYPGVAPVGSLTREVSGLYDMAGNVSEWVHDVYSIIPPVADTVLKNPMGGQGGDIHVVKGANFRSGTITTLRPAFREGLGTGRDDVGFRIGRYLFQGEHD